MKLRKVCIVGPGLSMGGIERASSNLANYLSTAGFDVSFVAVFRSEKFLTLNEEVRFFEPPGEGKTEKLKVLLTIKWLRKTVLEINPQTVIVFNKLYAALTLLGLKFTGIPVFASERSTPFRKWPPTQKMLIDFAFWISPPAGLIAQTSVAAEVQKKKYPGIPVEVIPNMLRDVKRYPSVKREKIILAVGRFGDFAKGFDRLVEAFGQLRDKEWKLVFAGGEAADNDVLSIIKKFGIEGRVAFLGKVSNLDEVFAKSGVFVIPSRHEGFPNALCEAMAAGLPCISFNFTAGPADMIIHGVNGILVENGNITALTNAIDSLIVDEQMRISLGNNATKVREKFSHHIVGPKLVNFIFQEQNHASSQG